ncbi:HlyC/CorC family transporter [Pseudoxanthomonas spadix]|jgi:magnesium and cobalt transporter|uniref:HlyC/CorC family transporter n=1 Tax=Pseudoxanthomonas spadix TaxID=415229 RepID=UPI0005B9EBBA|nr:transporter associated domain-containing protein [Pseudoxanthomonas spadix]MBP3973887.1 CBS domain-containing protein [Pseudoxanthomonas spadix]RMW95780.1 CBS domain-containing protein [Pseudoxanthomonas spadix]
MSEDDSTTASELPEKRRSWLERLSHAFSGEPESREDLLALLRDAQHNGLLEPDTLKMMEGAMSVAELTVGDVMISRSQMVSLPADTPFLELMRQVVESGHSRFPVHGENKDEILGILLAKDLLRGVVADQGPGTVRELLRPAVLIPESKKLNVLLKEFRLSRNHMALVVDEYGGVAGLVTIEDVLEQIVGEIDDEHDEADDEANLIAAQADGQYVVDALTPIEDFNARFGADFPDDEYDTVGGLVTDAMGHLPETGEELTLGRFAFRVARADGRRVHAFHVGVLSDS